MDGEAWMGYQRANGDVREGVGLQIRPERIFGIGAARYGCPSQFAWYCRAASGTQRRESEIELAEENGIVAELSFAATDHA
jgi:hypothetical protein